MSTATLRPELAHAKRVLANAALIAAVDQLRERAAQMAYERAGLDSEVATDDQATTCESDDSD